MINDKTKVLCFYLVFRSIFLHGDITDNNPSELSIIVKKPDIGGSKLVHVN